MSDTWETGQTGQTAGDANSDQSAELAVGDLAPDFTLPSGDGHEIALRTYRGKAHVVLFFVRAYG